MATFHRYLLGLTGIMLCLIGIAYCIDPNLLLGRYDLGVVGASEDNMYRGAYGGLFISLGAAITYGFYSASFRRTATLMALLFMSGFAAGRLVSVFATGLPHEQILNLLAFEIVTTLLFAWALITPQATAAQTTPPRGV